MAVAAAQLQARGALRARALYNVPLIFNIWGSNSIAPHRGQGSRATCRRGTCGGREGSLYCALALNRAAAAIMLCDNSQQEYKQKRCQFVQNARSA